MVLAREVKCLADGQESYNHALGMSKLRKVLHMLFKQTSCREHVIGLSLIA